MYKGPCFREVLNSPYLLIQNYTLAISLLQMFNKKSQVNPSIINCIKFWTRSELLEHSGCVGGRLDWMVEDFLPREVANNINGLGSRVCLKTADM